MKPICWVVETALPGGRAGRCAEAGGCITGFLLMHWRKKTRIEVVSCATFAYLQSQGFVFYSDCDFIQLSTDTKQIQTNLCYGPWSEITGR